MRDLSVFHDETFDLLVHPVSNTFVPEVAAVWREACRVLRPGAWLLSGFDNPVVHIFDSAAYELGKLRVAHALPYSDAEALSAEEIARRAQEGIPLEFGHTLEDLIGGQIDAGFEIVGFYEDRCPPEEDDLLGRYTCTFIATRAYKSARSTASGQQAHRLEKGSDCKRSQATFSPDRSSIGDSLKAKSSLTPFPP